MWLCAKQKTLRVAGFFVLGSVCLTLTLYRSELKQKSFIRSALQIKRRSYVFGDIYLRIGPVYDYVIVCANFLLVFF